LETNVKKTRYNLMAIIGCLLCIIWIGAIVIQIIYGPIDNKPKFPPPGDKKTVPASWRYP